MKVAPLHLVNDLFYISYMIYKPNKLFFQFALTASFILISITGFAQSLIFEVADCGSERRSMLYNKQLSNVLWCLNGKAKFNEDSLLTFSENNKIQIKELEQKTSLFKKSLPKYYFDDDVKVIRLDTKPNKDGRIWFEYIFAEQDLKGNFVIYSGFKVFFAGTDPVEERKHPKISEIIVLLDKNQLRNYYDTIRKLLADNEVTLPPPQKRNPNDGKEEKPPEVEKLEGQ